jgi:Arc/MetJ-type ribon-helix-helix transcriptional regulator
VTGPHGGKTTITPGGLRRVTLSLDELTIRRIEAEVEVGRATSRSDAVRRLARQLPRKPVT